MNIAITIPDTTTQGVRCASSLSIIQSKIVSVSSVVCAKLAEAEGEWMRWGRRG